MLLSIPSIPNNLAARILAELGDINRFSRIREITAYAGLDPHINQSGGNNGLHLKITKKEKRILDVYCI